MQDVINQMNLALPDDEQVVNQKFVDASIN